METQTENYKGYKIKYCKNGNDYIAISKKDSRTYNEKTIKEIKYLIDKANNSIKTTSLLFPNLTRELNKCARLRE